MERRNGGKRGEWKGVREESGKEWEESGKE